MLLVVSLSANFTNHKLLLEKPAGLLGENLPKDSPADRLKDYSIKIYDETRNEKKQRHDE